MKTAMKILSGCAMACLCGALALAEPPKKVEPAKKATTAAPGMIVVKDKDTGLLRPATAEEIGALQQGATTTTKKNAVATTKRNAAAAGAAATAPKVGPSGGVGLEMDESQAVFAVMTKGPDGKLRMSCVTGQKAADEKVLKASAQEESNEK